jgi:CheY-like chemotaxis protein
MPGGQLLNRFQDLGYRVQALADPRQLGETARREMPLLVVADTKFEQHDACTAIAELKQDPRTNHLPVIAIVPAGEEELAQKAQQAGAQLVVNDNAVHMHLNQLLQQALHIE